ncbi:MAG: PDZ domain-containing protein, partial [Verrucomicrobiota bacterium]
GGTHREIIKIESSEHGGGKETAREVAWLGLATEEAPEALASQLGLNPGEGLLVTYVSPESPAAKSGIQKYDVLLELNDQLLVLPAQLRKLVQMKKEGNAVKLLLHRGGKKQTVSIKLAKRNEDFGMSFEAPFPEENRHRVEFLLPKGIFSEELHNDIKAQMRSSIDKKTVNVEVQRNIEEVRKAIQEALRRSEAGNRTFGADTKGLEQLARGKVAIEKDASVTVRKGGPSVRTVVKSDDAGVFIIVANPKKHLTAHNNDGKLLFDGPIETEEQQQKVPADLWLKVKPTLDEIKPIEDGEPKPQALSDDSSKIRNKNPAIRVLTLT